ncbi:MAG: carotenoid biosynthesis protein [Thermodesulforhabdaceae bacterium]
MNTVTDFIHLLWNTILFRPYVFIFLGFYILSASLFFGVKRTLAFIPLGYSVAWVSEWCSTHYGIPYGFYRYIPDTIHKELWVGGVPFMDSLSYVFLSYAAYGTTFFLFLRYKLPIESFSSWRFTFLGAFLLIVLDIIIDPVALRGDEWFLGKIYEYPSGGIYFGVPLSNFGGWFLVGIVLMRFLQWFGKPRLAFPPRNSGLFLAVGLYIAVLIFNLSVTAYIGAWQLLAADMVVLSLSFLICRKVLLYWSSHTAIRDLS